MNGVPCLSTVAISPLPGLHNEGGFLQSLALPSIFLVNTWIRARKCMEIHTLCLDLPGILTLITAHTQSSAIC